MGLGGVDIERVAVRDSGTVRAARPWPALTLQRSAAVGGRIAAGGVGLLARQLLARQHVLSDVPMRTFVSVVAVAVLVSITSRLLTEDLSRSGALVVRTAGDLAATSAAAYAAGWGPMVTGFAALVMMVGPNAANGRALRPILAATVFCLAGGELAVAYRLAPSALTANQMHAVAGVIGWSVAMVEESFRASHRRVEGMRGTLELSEAHHRTLIEHGAEIVMVLGPDAVPSYVAPSYERVLGQGADERTRRRERERVHPEDAEGFERTWLSLLAAPGTSMFLEMRVARADGAWRWLATTLTNLVDDPAVRGIVLNAHDVTEEKEARLALDRAILYEPVTSLPNRRLLGDRLAHLLERRRRSDSRLIVLFIEIDDFELHARAHGSAAIDELLLTTARRLERLAGEDDLVACVGRHQFVMVTESSPDEAVSVAVAERTSRTLREPVIVDGVETYLTTSIGVARVHPGENDPNRLVSDAELAMRTARGEGGDRVALFAPADEHRAVSRVKMAGALRRAIEDDELEVHFQPIVRLATGDVHGAEALLRWNSPTEGLIMPDQFVHVAEASGLIVAIGTWVLEQACGIVAGAQTASGSGFEIAVNISARQLDDAELDATIERVLIDTGLDPGLLTLEVTETSLPIDAEAAIERLSPLRRLGVKIAIDDFGTGYSSLGYLKQLRPDVIKIDKTFIADFLSDPGDSAIVAAVLNLGKGVGIEVLAEGVESIEQAIALRELGCDFGQGYFFGRPNAADATSLAHGLQTTPMPARTPAPTRRRNRRHSSRHRPLTPPRPAARPPLVRPTARRGRSAYTIGRRCQRTRPARRAGG